MKKSFALIAALTFSLGAAAQGMSQVAVQTPQPVPAQSSVVQPDAVATVQPKKAAKTKKTKKALKAVKAGKAGKAVKAKSGAKVKAGKAAKKAKKAKKLAKTPKLTAKKAPTKTLH